MTYKQKRDATFTGDYYSNWLYDGNTQVLCVHDASYDGTPTTRYALSMSLGGGGKNYYLHDKFTFNESGDDLGRINYYSYSGATSNGNGARYTIAYLSRMFYMLRSNGWKLLHTYRWFITRNYEDVSTFKSFCNGKGAFKYFIQQGSDYNFSSSRYNYTDTHNKCNAYADFVKKLNNKYSIDNKKYTKPKDAKNNKKTTDITVSGSNWTVEVDAPHYSGNTSYYSGVKYEYKFIDSSSPNYTSGWNSISPDNSAGTGYVNLKFKGTLPSNNNLDILMFKCTYKVYSGVALGFATASSQERFVVDGAESTYTTYVAFEVKQDANVEINKYITNLYKVSDPTNLYASFSRASKDLDYKENNPVMAELGDGVEFTISLKNNTSKKVIVKVTDKYNSDIFEVDTSRISSRWSNHPTESHALIRTIEISANSTKTFTVPLKIKAGATQR